MRPNDPLAALSPADRELVGHAVDLLRTRGRAGYHSVAAAVRAGDRLFAGLDLASRKSSVCAEPAAISAAHSAGSYALDAIVAVCLREDISSFASISPCGACRELISYQAPDCRVLFEYEGSLIDERARDLFRYPLIFG